MGREELSKSKSKHMNKNAEHMFFKIFFFFLRQNRYTQGVSFNSHKISSMTTRVLSTKCNRKIKKIYKASL